MKTGIPGRVRRVWAAIPRWALWGAGGVVLFLVVSLALVVAYYERVVSRTMDGRRWSLPTRLYSDVWVLRPGDALGPDDVERRLSRLRYAPLPAPPVVPGRYFFSSEQRAVNIRLSIATLDEREIEEGVRRLARALDVIYSGR